MYGLKKTARVKNSTEFRWKNLRNCTFMFSSNWGKKHHCSTYRWNLISVRKIDVCRFGARDLNRSFSAFCLSEASALAPRPAAIRSSMAKRGKDPEDPGIKFHLMFFRMVAWCFPVHWIQSMDNVRGLHNVKTSKRRRSKHSCSVQLVH